MQHGNWYVSSSLWSYFFLFSKQISYYAQSILPDLSGNGSEDLRGGFVLPSWDILWLSVHAHFSASFLCLCSCPAVLVSRSQKKDVCHRKMLPYLHMSPFPSHTLLFLSACYCQQPLVGSMLFHHCCLRHQH